MIETKSELRAANRVRWNMNTCFVALVLLAGSGCSDDAKPGSGNDSQGEAGRSVDTPAAGSGSKTAGAGGSGGSAGTPPREAGSGGSAGSRAGTGGSAGTSAADGGRDAPAAGAGGESGSAGSAGEPGAGEPPSASDIARSLAAAICDALEQCVGPQKLAALNNREACETRFAAALSQDDFGSLEASIDAGTVKLDPTKLEACYEDTRALGCKFQVERLPASCASAIAGQRAEGESCSIGAECRSGTFCPIDLECPRSCEATRDEGGECTRDAECQRGTICHDGFCSAPALKGQACAGDSGVNCALGLSCVGSTDTQAGSCQENATVQAGARGATCNPGGTLCQEGLSCAFDSGSTFKCVGPVGRGETCKLALPAQCPVDTYCDAEDVTVTGKCVALPTDGMACVLGDDCAPGHVCVTQDGTATCRKIGDLGDACAADALCRSGFCAAGGCELRTRCE